MINIAIVEDHPIERLALRSLFAIHEDMQVIGEGGNGRDAIELARDPALNVMVLDLAMPGLSGIDGMVRIRASRPALGVLVLSGFAEELYALNMIHRGAAGYLNKLVDPAEIVVAVRSIAEGRKHLTPTVIELLSSRLASDRQSARHELLSRREFQILLRLARGAKLKEIAHDMSITTKTVAAHRAQVMAKMEMSTNAHLTRYAVTHGLVN